MAIVAKVRKIGRRIRESGDIQEVRELARKGVEKLASEEFQKELALRKGIGSPFEVKVPKRKQPTRKPTVTKRKMLKEPKPEPKKFVKLYTKRSSATKKYRVEFKIVGKKLGRRWFTTLPDARKFASKKAKTIGVKVTNVQSA